MKTFTKYLKFFLLLLIEFECGLARKWCMSSHKRLMMIQWGIGNLPQHFDHHIDLYYQWLTSRNPMWLQRGFFSTLGMRGGDLLELGCGDGFNTRNFYSTYMDTITAIDIDEKAILTAKAKNFHNNIVYIRGDILSDMPERFYDNIVWDFGFPFLTYFSYEKLNFIMLEIAKRMKQNSIFSGYTIASDTTDRNFSISSKSELKNFLLKYFKYVSVFETKSPNRLNLYFWASNENIAFGFN